MMQFFSIKSLFFFFLLFIKSSHTSTVKPFFSDGCTLAPDGTFAETNLWRECCEEHDLRFWGGGTQTQRLEADYHLKLCIQHKSNDMIATLFMWGVQLGSLSPLKFESKKWGNAWEHKNPSYFQLTKSEIDLLLMELKRISLKTEILQRYKVWLEQQI